MSSHMVNADPSGVLSQLCLDLVRHQVVKIATPTPLLPSQNGKIIDISLNALDERFAVPGAGGFSCSRSSTRDTCPRTARTSN